MRPAALGLVLALSACTPLGRVPADLVTLYDQATPSGVIELEIDRSGAIREMEAEIDPASLPENVRAAAMAKMPGARVTGAEREIKQGARAWEVKLQHEDRAWELIIDASGAIIETEKELRRDEAPPAVLESADRAVPGGQFESVELIERGATTEFHVKKSLEGASYKIVLGPDGALIRRVREARAEIEIPLQ